MRGRTIEIRWWGAGLTSEPPLVLLHEGLGSVAMWRNFPEALATRTDRHVMAYSRLGHGESDPPPAPHTTHFMHEEATDWLPLILAAADIDRAGLVGHSDGGSIALIFAATYPSAVPQLVLQAPHVFVEDVSLASISRMKTQYETSNVRERLAKYHKNVDAAFHGWNDVWLDAKFRRWNLESYLPRVTCPVLVIQGEHDEYGTEQQVDAIAAQVSAPVEKLILPACGHSPHREQPEAVLSAIAGFLEHAPQSRSRVG